MIQIKTLLIRGEFKNIAGGRISTLQADLEKQTNAELAKLEGAVTSLDVKVQDGSAATAGFATVVIQYESDKKKGGK